MDLEVARELTRAGRYSHAAFFAHLAAEKALKAAILSRTRSDPPLSHHLRLLAERTGAALPPEVETAILRLMPHYTAARWPDVAQGPPEASYNREIALELLRAADTALAWAERLSAQAHDQGGIEGRPAVRPADASQPETVLRAIEAFVRHLRGEMRVRTVLLFGSRARGDWLHDSDVDLLVLSPDFEGIPHLERLEKLCRTWYAATDLPADVLGLTSEEFAQRLRQIDLVGEIARDGVVVYREGDWTWPAPAP